MSKRTCTIDGCDTPRTKREWCNKHYRRWLKHGDPTVTLVQRVTGPPDVRFFAKVDKDGPNGCWVWTAGTFKHRNGYGQFQASEVKGDTVYAHRWSYEHHVGPIPDGLHVLHSCDNPPCVNPAHLRVGTHDENMQDKAERDRVHNRSITPAQARAVKRALASESSPTRVADVTGVPRGIVKAIKYGQSWRSA